MLSDAPPRDPTPHVVQEVPSIVDREHRAAFAAATEHVTLVGDSPSAQASVPHACAARAALPSSAFSELVAV